MYVELRRCISFTNLVVVVQSMCSFLFDQTFIYLHMCIINELSEIRSNLGWKNWSQNRNRDDVVSGQDKSLMEYLSVKATTLKLKPGQQP